jgi:Holliday junction resolvasome RuvABC DNA-binding subunit
LITLCEAHHLALHEGSLLLEGAPPSVTFTRRTSSSFAVAARAVETAGALRRLGYKPDEVKAAVDATRTHVGKYDLAIEQWIKIALSKCSRLAS